jgi:hypothetical protein
LVTWQRQRGEFQKHQRRLAITDQLIKQRHRPVDPVNPHQHQREKAEQHHQL